MKPLIYSYLVHYINNDEALNSQLFWTYDGISLLGNISIYSVVWTYVVGLFIEKFEHLLVLLNAQAFVGNYYRAHSMAWYIE